MNDEVQSLESLQDSLHFSHDLIYLYDYLVVASLDLKKGIAIAINDEVIRRSDWAVTKIQNNDRILIIQATQGG